MKEKVLKVVSQIMNVPVKELSEDSSPDTIERWDSLQHMNLVLALEQEFNVSFTDQQIIEMMNVALICETLKEKGICKI